MAPTEIIVTGDGSHSLLNTELNETYHSVHGALRESQYVFIEQGLDYWMQRNANESARVLEIGFGTGLNALLTLAYALHNARTVTYDTLEAYPLPASIWTQLNYGDDAVMRSRFEKLNALPWDMPHALEERFMITKHYASIQDKAFSEKFDVIFYDAFAPSKQPDMWTFDVLCKITSALAPQGIFVTYCAKGQVKRDLRQLGLIVETLPGPPGKKEMVRARNV